MLLSDPVALLTFGLLGSVEVGSLKGFGGVIGSIEGVSVSGAYGDSARG